MRFASSVFDRYRDRLLSIDRYPEMDRFLKEADVAGQFRAFAAKDGITCSQAEWEKTTPYLIPQINALVSRFSKLGENAFYKYYLPTDNTVNKVLEELKVP